MLVTVDTPAATSAAPEPRPADCKNCRQRAPSVGMRCTNCGYVRRPEAAQPAPAKAPPRKKK